jgi:hypothetical protein
VLFLFARLWSACILKFFKKIIVQHASRFYNFINLWVPHIEYAIGDKNLVDRFYLYAVTTTQIGVFPTLIQEYFFRYQGFPYQFG